jgi:hypothetical protein
MAEGAVGSGDAASCSAGAGGPVAAGPMYPSRQALEGRSFSRRGEHRWRVL